MQKYIKQISATNHWWLITITVGCLISVSYLGVGYFGYVPSLSGISKRRKWPLKWQNGRIIFFACLFQKIYVKKSIFWYLVPTLSKIFLLKFVGTPLSPVRNYWVRACLIYFLNVPETLSLFPVADKVLENYYIYAIWSSGHLTMI